MEIKAGAAADFYYWGVRTAAPCQFIRQLELGTRKIYVDMANLMINFVFHILWLSINKT